MCVCKLTVDCLLLTVAHTLHQHRGTLCDIFISLRQRRLRKLFCSLLQSVAFGRYLSDGCCIFVLGNLLIGSKTATDAGTSAEISLLNLSRVTRKKI